MKKDLIIIRNNNESKNIKCVQLKNKIEQNRIKTNK